MKASLGSEAFVRYLVKFSATGLFNSLSAFSIKTTIIKDKLYDLFFSSRRELSSSRRELSNPR
jgi:hypothetical protein